MEVTDFYSSNDVPKTFTGICRYPLGTLVWFKDGEPHRDDGPAMEFYDGQHLWYWEGRLSSPMDVFDQLTDEQKEKAIWNMDEWK